MLVRGPILGRSMRRGERVDKHAVAAAGVVLCPEVHRRDALITERAVHDPPTACLDRSFEQIDDRLAVSVDAVKLRDVEAPRQFWHDPSVSRRESHASDRVAWSAYPPRRGTRGACSLAANGTCRLVKWLPTA